MIAFDRGQERILREWAPDDQRPKVQLLTAFDPEARDVIDVPDPYYSDAALFDSVLVTIERASTALFRQLEPVSFATQIHVAQPSIPADPGSTVDVRPAAAAPLRIADGLASKWFYRPRVWVR